MERIGVADPPMLIAVLPLPAESNVATPPAPGTVPPQFAALPQRLSALPDQTWARSGRPPTATSANVSTTRGRMDVMAVWLRNGTRHSRTGSHEPCHGEEGVDRPRVGFGEIGPA